MVNRGDVAAGRTDAPDALTPVHGIYMRDVTVYSVHPVYAFYGWHCYHVCGEVFG